MALKFLGRLAVYLLGVSGLALILGAVAFLARAWWLDWPLYRAEFTARGLATLGFTALAAAFYLTERFGPGWSSRR